MARVYDAGAIVGDHQLVERLGAGGFGEVWRAKRLPDGDARAVPGEPADTALKVASEPGRARSLAREAALAAALDHPGIVKTYRIRLDLEPPHLVLELVRGEDLRKRLTSKGGKIAWQGAVRIAADAAEAVAHAHAQGIVHGDVKPENILLEKRTGRVRVTDFGLGREVAPDQASLSLSLSKSMTGVAGTLSYMAPEMLEGGKATKETDVYALGAVLYEMVTGAPPAGAFLLPSEMDWSLPDELDRILDRRALDGDPAARPPDAAAFLRGMKPLLDAAGPDPREISKPKPAKQASKAALARAIVNRKAKKGEAACPRCEIRLCRARYGGTRVRACPRCRGVWIERQPLEHIFSRKRDTSAGAVVPTAEVKNPSAEGQLPCVSCPGPMEKMLLGAGSVEATLVDICRGHGVWFDPGEVERAVAVFARSPIALTAVLSRLGAAVVARDGKTAKRKKPAKKA